MRAAGRGGIATELGRGAKGLRVRPGRRASRGRPGRASGGNGVSGGLVRVTSGVAGVPAGGTIGAGADVTVSVDAMGGVDAMGAGIGGRSGSCTASIRSSDRGFEDVEEEGVDRRVHWTIVKRTVADQISRKPMSASYVLQRDEVESDFPSLGAARSAVNKTIVHPEKLTLSKADHAGGQEQ